MRKLARTFLDSTKKAFLGPCQRCFLLVFVDPYAFQGRAAMKIVCASVGPWLRPNVLQCPLRALIETQGFLLSQAPALPGSASFEVWLATGNGRCVPPDVVATSQAPVGLGNPKLREQVWERVLNWWPCWVLFALSMDLGPLA